MKLTRQELDDALRDYRDAVLDREQAGTPGAEEEAKARMRGIEEALEGALCIPAPASLTCGVVKEHSLVALACESCGATAHGTFSAVVSLDSALDAVARCVRNGYTYAPSLNCKHVRQELEALTDDRLAELAHLSIGVSRDGAALLARLRRDALTQGNARPNSYPNAEEWVNLLSLVTGLYQTVREIEMEMNR